MGVKKHRKIGEKGEQERTNTRFALLICIYPIRVHPAWFRAYTVTHSPPPSSIRTGYVCKSQSPCKPIPVARSNLRE